MRKFVMSILLVNPLHLAKTNLSDDGSCSNNLIPTFTEAWTCTNFFKHHFVLLLIVGFIVNLTKSGYIKNVQNSHEFDN